MMKKNNCLFLVHAVAVACITCTHAIRIVPTNDGFDRRRRAAAEEEVLRSIITPKEKNNHNNNNDNRPHVRTLSTDHVDVKVPTNPDDHLVTELPLLDRADFGTQHWAGLLPASNDETKYLFYWLFAPADAEGHPVEDNDQIPLVIWINGGPGCSSMDGLFIENGPFRFVLSNPENNTSAWKLAPAEYSWHKLPAYTLYIDQPVGTGLSFVQGARKKYPRNDLEVNIDFYYFLQEFFHLHSDKFVDDNNNNKQTKRPFYFSGESHSGHYIPSMMSYMLQQNKNIRESNQQNNDSENKHDIILNMNGAAIGNGWMDPYNQYAAGRAAYGYGIVDDAQLNALNEKETKCQHILNKGTYTAGICFDLLDDVVKASHGVADGFKISQYDYSILEDNHAPRTFPLGHKTVEAYLGGRSTETEGGSLPPSAALEQVLRSIHAYDGRLAGQHYLECTDPPYNALAHQDGLGVVDDVIDVLNHDDEGKKVRLLFFNGMNDLICNHVGNEIFLTKMQWNYQNEWIASKRYAWKAQSEKTNGKINGYMKEYQNLLFLKILDSGHMVPMDIPNVAFDMMKLFTSDRDATFQYSEQRLTAKKAPSSSNNDSKDCPTCPTCHLNNESNDDNAANTSTAEKTSLLQSSSSAGAGPSIIVNSWVYAILLAGIVILVTSLIRSRGARRTRSMTNMNANDLELRKTEYTDDKDSYD